MEDGASQLEVADLDRAVELGSKLRELHEVGVGGSRWETLRDTGRHWETLGDIGRHKQRVLERAGVVGSHPRLNIGRRWK